MMQSESAQLSPRKPPRSQGPRHAFDRRTTAAKRYRSLIEQFTSEAGGNLSEAKRAIVEQLVGVVMQSEALTAAIVRGDVVDAEQQVRLANVRSRLMRDLGISQGGGKPVEPPRRTLADHLAAQRGAAA